VAGNAVTASFTIKNDGGTKADVSTLLLGARDANGANVDFPAVGPLTIEPGATYTYQQLRTITTTGSLVFWPAAYTGGNWTELSLRQTVTVYAPCAPPTGQVTYNYFPPAQTIDGPTGLTTVPAGRIHQTAWAETGNGVGAADLDGAYAYPFQGWSSLVWRWADTMRHGSIRMVVGPRGGTGYRMELTPDDHSSP
jgi:hypothetical protein